MPIRKVSGGYKWGSSGKVYKTRAGAERQAAAAYASGYKGADKKSAGGSVPKGYHRMPDGSVMKDSAHMKSGGATKSRVNEAGNYTKPSLRKRIFNEVKAGGKGGKPGQWSARKAQMLAKRYKDAGGGYKD
jgi:hypothetical protein